MQLSARFLGTLFISAVFYTVASAQTPPPVAEAVTKSATAAPRNQGFRGSADKPSPRSDRNSQIAHEQLVAKAKKGGIDVYFVGDSITRRWGTSDPQYQEMLENWKGNFFGWNAGNFGWGADRIENILWRLRTANWTE